MDNQPNFYWLITNKACSFYDLPARLLHNDRFYLRKDSSLQDSNLITVTTLMPTATDPCKRVFSIFTIIIREPQRQIRDRTNKIAPIAPSPIFLEPKN